MVLFSFFLLILTLEFHVQFYFIYKYRVWLWYRCLVHCCFKKISLHFEFWFGYKDVDLFMRTLYSNSMRYDNLKHNAIQFQLWWASKPVWLDRPGYWFVSPSSHHSHCPDPVLYLLYGMLPRNKEDMEKGVHSYQNFPIFTSAILFSISILLECEQILKLNYWIHCAQIFFTGIIKAWHIFPKFLW